MAKKCIYGNFMQCKHRCIQPSLFSCKKYVVAYYIIEKSMNVKQFSFKYGSCICILKISSKMHTKVFSCFPQHHYSVLCSKKGKGLTY